QAVPSLRRASRHARARVASCGSRARPGSMERTGERRRATPVEHFGTAVLALLLGGCAAFDRAAPHAVTSDRTVPLDARVVAWLVGDLCRAAHPGIDPSPVDATLPVLAEGDGALRFRIARPADGPWRVACNARLAAPRRALAG